MASRVHRRLLMEELEPRIAPAYVWNPLGDSVSGGGISNMPAAAYFPKADIAWDGLPVVAWQGQCSSGTDIYVRHWDGCAWETVGTSDNISNTAERSATPDLDCNAAGYPVVAWVETSSCGASTDIYLRMWNGSSWIELGGSASGGGISMTGMASDPSVACGSAGTIYVAWVDKSAGNNEIFLREWNGSSWIELGGSASTWPMVIAGAMPATEGGVSVGGISGSCYNSLYPSVAVNTSSGYPAVSWAESNGSNMEIYVRRWNGCCWVEMGSGSASGGGISKNGGASLHPDMAIPSSGEGVVVWDDTSGPGHTEVYGREFNGSTWDEIGPYSATGGGIDQNPCYSLFPSLAFDSGGYPVVAWQQVTSGRMDIYLKHFNGSCWVEWGNNSASYRGLSSTPGNAACPSLAIGSDGYPVVVWQDSSSGKWQIYCRKLGWYDSDLTISVGGVYGPPAVQPGGQFQVSYTESNLAPVPAGPYEVAFYLSSNAIAGDSDDIFLGQISEPTGLGANQSRARRDTFTMPSGVPEGSYYVYGFVDCTGMEPESDETNNFGFTASPVVVATGGRVLWAGDRTMVWFDSDGDRMSLTYSGPGCIIVKDALGGRPDLSSSDIATGVILGSTSRSALLLRDLDGCETPNTATLGNTVASSSPFGVVTINEPGGSIFGTSLQVGSDLGTLALNAQSSSVNLSVGGNLRQETIWGNASLCTTSVMGNAGSLQISGDTFQSSFFFDNALAQATIRGSFNGVSQLEVGGLLTSLTIQGALNASSILAQGINSFFAGSIADSSVVATGFLGKGRCASEMSYSRLQSGGNADEIYIGGGIIHSGPSPLSVDVASNLGRLTVNGQVSMAGLSVGGNVGLVQFSAMTAGMALNVSGGVTRALFLGGTSSSSISIAGPVGYLKAAGNQMGSSIQMGGVPGQVLLYGLDATTVSVTGNVASLTTYGPVKNGSGITISGSVGVATLQDGILNSSFGVLGNVGKFVSNGRVEMASIGVQGNAGLFRATQGIRGTSMVMITGEVNQAYIANVNKAESLDPTSSLEIGYLFGPMNVVGPLRGLINITGPSLCGPISISGDMSGQVIAGLFGNVTINGKFDGTLGNSSTSPGMNNTLRVTQQGGSGVVIPSNAFAHYIGYTP